MPLSGGFAALIAKAMSPKSGARQYGSSKKTRGCCHPRVFCLRFAGDGEPCPRFVTATERGSRYFACMALMSATLPDRWHSVHCSLFVKVMVEAVPIAGRVATEETLENNV